MKIEKIHAREALDSSGRPTVEMGVVLKDGTWEGLLYLEGRPPDNKRQSSLGMVNNAFLAGECSGPCAL
ncbi:MAG: hypothetical protein ACE5HC_09160 [Candidatus Binatia bacterium]